MKATAKYTVIVEMDGDKEEDILFDSRLFSYHLRRMLDTYARIGYVHIERYWMGDIETDMGTPMTINRRGKCERCGCSIDGVGLCARCREIMDEGIVNPDDGALRDYLRRFREEEDME